MSDRPGDAEGNESETASEAILRSLAQSSTPVSAVELYTKLGLPREVVRSALLGLASGRRVAVDTRMRVHLAEGAH